MSTNLTDIHVVRLFNPNAAVHPHRLKRPFVIYDEPLDPTAFVQPDNPTSRFASAPSQQQIAAEQAQQFAQSGAPPFAPGGPLNPYPASAGMAPPSFNLPPGVQPSTNIPGQPGFDPEQFEAENESLTQQVFQVPQGPGLSAAGGFGAAVIPPTTRGTNPPPSVQQGQIPGRLPGKVIGPFQPGGGQPKMPNAQQMPRMQNPMPVPQPQPPFQPNPLQGQQSGAKPRGYRTIPMPERHHPPTEPPKPPGQWVTIDAGRGMPPAYGFLAQREEPEVGVDTGLEGPHTHSTGRASEAYGSSGRATGEKSGSKEKGHYVPIQLGASTDEEPSWVWVPEIDPEYGVRKRDYDDDKPKVNPLGK